MEYGYSYSGVVAQARSDERAAFIRRTYAHLAGAILAFVGLEALLLYAANGAAAEQMLTMLAGSRISWLFVMLAFMGASWIAQMWARSETSPALQYAGLALYVVAEAVIFLPLLYIAKNYCGPSVIPTA